MTKEHKELLIELVKKDQEEAEAPVQTRSQKKKDLKQIVPKKIIKPTTKTNI